MKPKHTPGPWKVVKDVTEPVHHFDIQCANGFQVARLYPFQRAREENARLIAAAPELLEACETVLRSIEDEELTLEECRDLLVATLSKARGKS